MINTKTIKKLYIDHAQYLIEDGSGKKVLVKVNYAQGKFDVVGSGKKEFISDVQKFAKDLIARKSNVNFA